MEINAIETFLHALDGKYDPNCDGGHFIMSDGAPLCKKCAREDKEYITEAIHCNSDDGWRVIGYEINYDDPYERCCNCGEAIPNAFGIEEDENESDD